MRPMRSVFPAGAVLVALAVLIRTAGPTEAEAVELVGENCWDCEDCSDGDSHKDRLPPLGEEGGSLTGGTYVNMCGYAYSSCPGLHSSCEPEDDDDIPLTAAALNQLEREIQRGEGAVLDYLERFPWGRINRAAGAVEVWNCNHQLIANFPMPRLAD